MAARTETVTLADGTPVDLHHFHEGEDALLVRTRTGTKIHRGWAGGASTGCGVWLRAPGSRFKVDPARVHASNLCESCFPVYAAAAASAAADTAAESGDGTGAADNATTSEEDSMPGKTAPSRARSAAAPVAEKLDGETISKALEAAVKTRVRGMKTARSKDGFSRYLRVTVNGRDLTLARVTNRAKVASVKIGTAAPFKLDTTAQAKIEQIAERIAKRAEEAKK